MITKFKDRVNLFSTIEFSREEKNLTITLKEKDFENPIKITLSSQDLFDLIGQLLRIQADIKKGIDNGKW